MPQAGVGALLTSIIVACIVLMAGGEPARAQVARAVHYQSAEISVSTPAHYADPPPILAQNAVPAAWRRLALPHAVLRAGGGDKTLISTWYRLHYISSPSRQAVYLYAPRWQVTGQLAIYADRRLIYAPRSGPQWMCFNLPIWAKLADSGAPIPSEILINIISERSNGGGISTVWIGDERALQLRHAVRYWLQHDLTIVVSAFDALFGIAALIFWVWWRREPAFLLLACATLFNIVWETQFRTGEAPLFISEPWFGWMTTCALEWWILSAYLFALQVIGSRFRGLAAALIAFTALFTVLTMPDLGPGVSLVSASLSPLLDLVTLVGVAVMTVSVWAAFYRKPSHEGLVVCLYSTVWPLAGLHDLLWQDYKLSIESICLAPILFSLIPFAMAYIMIRRYLLAMKAVDEHALRLQNRVREREAELQVSYARLGEVERREAVATERQRLMRDMHDGMGSVLMGALAAVERGRLKDVDIAKMLRECIDDLKLTIDSMETVDADLPLILATLRYRLAPRFEQAGIDLIWRVGHTPLARLDAERALHVMRMVQEMFTNVVKHAHASRVVVTTDMSCDAIVLVVEDNGVGFAVDLGDKPRGRGLANLRYRAAVIGAAVTWTSSPGITRYELRLPLASGADQPVAG